MLVMQKEANGRNTEKDVVVIWKEGGGHDTEGRGYGRSPHFKIPTSQTKILRGYIFGMLLFGRLFGRWFGCTP